MSDDFKARARTFFDDISEGRFDSTATVFADDAVMHGPMGDLEGIEQITGLGAVFKGALPDGRVRVLDVAVDGDRAAWLIEGHGTHEGDLGALKASGKPVRWTNTDFMRLRDGKVVEIWGGPDMWAIAKQTGAVPLA
jgi:predicted ester cyclase